MFHEIIGIIPNLGKRSLWKGRIILLDRLNVNTSTINLINDYQKALYPYIISEDERLTETRAMEYWASLFWKLVIISELLLLGLVSTPTKVHIVVGGKYRIFWD